MTARHKQRGLGLGTGGIGAGGVGLWVEDAYRRPTGNKGPVMKTLAPPDSRQAEEKEKKNESWSLHYKRVGRY